MNLFIQKVPCQIALRILAEKGNIRVRYLVLFRLKKTRTRYLSLCPTVETVAIPVADGGEGTMDSLIAATNGKKVDVTVSGPLLEPVKAAYGVLGDEETCVIEMASASGLILSQKRCEIRCLPQHMEQGKC